jgi:urease accessory protein
MNMAPATDPVADADLLQLIWLASPALPVGGFSYSEGLESAVDAGLVADGDGAARWLLAQLQLGLARSDLAVVCQAVAAWRSGDQRRIDELDAWVLASRETSEMRQQTVQMGRSMIEWLKSVRPEQVPTGRVAPSYPVAFALAAACGRAPVRTVGLCFAFGWAENMVQAAVKAVPLGQSAGQRILLQLAAGIPAAVDLALEQADEDRQAFTPMLAILSAQHETQYSRLFRS